MELGDTGIFDDVVRHSGILVEIPGGVPLLPDMLHKVSANSMKVTAPHFN
jgi:hypothetical protein